MGDCVGCARNTPFDAELAFARLADKNKQIARVVAEFASIIAKTSESDEHRSSALIVKKVLERITGGTPTDKYPDCCLLGRRNPNHTLSWFCSGVLIHPQIVLSAGHCFTGTNANIVALNASDQNELMAAEIISIKRFVVHPRYIQSKEFSDISVCILHKPAKTTPAALATTSDLVSSGQIQLVGFGNDDVSSTKGFGVKREVEVSLTVVRKSPDDDLDDSEHLLGFESDYEFVAGGRGFDSCNGDSGGPAYILKDGTHLVAGLTSRGTNTSTHNCGDGGIYTRVDVHLDFISEVARSAGVDFPGAPAHGEQAVAEAGSP